MSLYVYSFHPLQEGIKQPLANLRHVTAQGFYLDSRKFVLAGTCSMMYGQFLTIYKYTCNNKVDVQCILGYTGSYLRTVTVRKLRRLHDGFNRYG